MKPRHQAREVALQILYRHDGAPREQTDAQLIRDLSDHFDHFQVPQELREFAAELVAGTLRTLTELDALIEKHTSNWKLGRMASVDRTVLRMAVYEMKRFPETAPSIVIDEAIELSKAFGTEDSAAFVNGVLDAVKATLKNPQLT